jgi:hypothetical protein
MSIPWPHIRSYIYNKRGREFCELLPFIKANLTCDKNSRSTIPLLFAVVACGCRTERRDTALSAPPPPFKGTVLGYLRFPAVACGCRTERRDTALSAPPPPFKGTVLGYLRFATVAFVVTARKREGILHYQSPYLLTY